MLGDLFFRNVAPSELNNMFYKEIKYWYRWHKVMEKAEKDAIEKAKSNK